MPVADGEAQLGFSGRPDDQACPDRLYFERAGGARKSVLKKLRAGKLPVQSKLDLHGLNVEQARQQLHWFEPFHTVLDWSNPPFARWFEGGTTNLSFGQAREPSLALDHRGEAVVAWAQEVNGNFEIYLKRFDGSAWREVDGSATGGGISNTHADSRYPSLDIRGDRACVAWTDAGPSGLQVAARCIDLPE